MNLMLEELLRVEHVNQRNLETGEGPAITGVTTDSRTVKPGDLFFALRGERYDGHRFVRDAMEKGAAAAIVEADAPLDRDNAMRGFPLLFVKNTVESLGKLANLYRTRYSIPLIAITGSNGKTTTKDMIAAVLGSEFRILSTEGNLNNQIGLPLMLFRIESDHEVAVLEMGTNHFGEIKHLCTVAEPTHGLVTNIGRAHLEFFDSLEGVARAKGEMFDWLSAAQGTNPVAFVNADDPLVRKASEKVRNRITYGFEFPEADVRGIYLGMDDECRAKFEIKSEVLPIDEVIELNVVGRHAVESALAAVAVGLKFEVRPERIKTSLEQFRPLQRRMEILKEGGVTILNDTYNSNPDSAIAALKTLASMASGGRKVAVLGDMLELGRSSSEEHAKVGVVLSDLGLEYLLTFGPHSSSTESSAKALYSRHFDEKGDLILELLGLVKAGDVVLVKGSRGMQMEDVVNALVEKLKNRS